MPSTQDVRKKTRRFRILIVGRANAGKTTILQKVCNTAEKPEIFDGKGDKIDADRGYHDINNELVFQSNPRFVFHDSCVFEAGGEDEFEKMKQFVSERASARKLNDRIHAIWYCIPMDEYHRAITTAEERFFSECDTNNVPVVAVFTKFDALSSVALGQLRKIVPSLSRKDIFEGTPKRVEDIFTNANIWGRLCATRHPPKDCVRLAKMNIDGANCVPLLECTGATLRDEALQKLLISTQTNLELSINTESNDSEGDMDEDSDDDASFVDATLSSPASVVQNVASAALPSYYQPQERHDAPQVSTQEQAELDVSALLQDLTKYITKIGDYAVARGGFGEIWRCTYSTDQGPVPVAVKSLLVYASDPQMEKKTERIQRELRICARLEHQNILPVYGYTFGFSPLMAIVSPWAENGNLIVYMERANTTTLTVVRRFEILKDITAGLKYLHDNNVIHGDLTGPNILIHADGTACLADFGLSLLYSEVAGVTQASWTSSLHGNVRWIAPELLEPSGNDMPVRPRKHSDVYSFGGIMLLVLTNQSPYYYLHERAVIQWIYSGKKIDRLRYPTLSENYWNFIETCWSAATHARPSADNVAQVISDEFHWLSSSANNF